MLSLDRCRQIAELCQKADEIWDGVGDETDKPSLWQERVFSFALSQGRDIRPPFPEPMSTDRVKLFRAICEALVGIEETTNPPLPPPPSPQPPQVSAPTRLATEEATLTGGWVQGPDGKNHWAGAPRGERRVRSATPEEMERINARIREAEQKR